MDARYMCPQCGSDDVRRVEMIWKEQTGDIMRIRRRELQKTLQCLTPAEHRLVCLATIRRTRWRNPSEENLNALSPVCMDAIKRALQKMKKKMENNGTEGK